MQSVGVLDVMPVVRLVVAYSFFCCCLTCLVCIAFAMFGTGTPDDLIYVGMVSASDGLGNEKQVLITAVAI